MKYISHPFVDSLFSQTHNGGKLWKDKIEKRREREKRKNIIIQDISLQKKEEKVFPSGKKGEKVFPSGKKGEEEEISGSQKWWVAVLLGLIFFIIASPCFLSFTNSFLGTGNNGSITLFGLFIHMLIFIIFVRIILY